jgi:Putative 2OG-Fe(II) oxygenase
MRVKDGTLLLFPAYLEHSVGPNESPDVRISVSFNVMFAEYAETMSPPQW